MRIYSASTNFSNACGFRPYDQYYMRLEGILYHYCNNKLKFTNTKSHTKMHKQRGQWEIKGVSIFDFCTFSNIQTC